MAIKKKKTDTYFFKKVVKIPIYEGNFIILFTNDTGRVAKTVGLKDKIYDLYGHTFHNFLYGGRESFCVCFNFWGEHPITIGTLIHEVTHAGNRLLSSREFDPDWWNDEAEAYLKGWMGDEIEKFIKKCGIA